VALAGHDGDQSLARAALGDPDPSVRASALGALERLGALDDPTLRGALGDPAPVVRRRAATLAAGHRGVSPLAALDDPDPAVVEVAAFAIGEQEDCTTSTIERLAELARDHRDPLVREAAVAALGAIGDVAGLPAVLAGTTDKPNVRRRAVIALAAFEGPAVDEALERALQDRDWQVRQAAEDLTRDTPGQAAGDAEPEG
jgi:HEAT repeat protein